MQDLLYAHGQSLAAAGDLPRHLIRDPWDRPVTADPLIGELDTHTGHGTFIAGIVRQIAPDATVLALRIMHSDGIVYEGDLLYALGLLAARVSAALDGDLSQMVDVVAAVAGLFQRDSIRSGVHLRAVAGGQTAPGDGRRGHRRRRQLLHQPQVLPGRLRRPGRTRQTACR